MYVPHVQHPSAERAAARFLPGSERERRSEQRRRDVEAGFLRILAERDQHGGQHRSSWRVLRTAPGRARPADPGSLASVRRWPARWLQHQQRRSARRVGSLLDAGGGPTPPPRGAPPPPIPGASPLSGAGQPAGSNTNSADQPAGSGASSSSSTPGVQSPGPAVPKTIKREPLTSAQKLAKAMKACKNKPKGKQAACKKQAHKKYATTAWHTKKE